MIKKQVKLNEMKPGRRYTIEVPANFSAGIDVTYDHGWSAADGDRFPVPDFRPVGVVLKFSGVNMVDGIKVTEFIDWETGSVYKSKLTGKLYLREPDGWICLKYQGHSSYAIPDVGARSDFETSLIRLVEEK